MLNQNSSVFSASGGALSVTAGRLSFSLGLVGPCYSIDAACASSAIAMDNCVLKCVSARCYDNVYGGDPLEEGEIDVARGRTFRSCARTELRGAKNIAAERAAFERSGSL